MVIGFIDRKRFGGYVSANNVCAMEVCGHIIDTLFVSTQYQMHRIISKVKQDFSLIFKKVITISAVQYGYVINVH